MKSADKSSDLISATKPVPSALRLAGVMLSCKAKLQYLYTSQVRGYCLMSLQSSIVDSSPKSISHRVGVNSDHGLNVR